MDWLRPQLLLLILPVLGVLLWASARTSHPMNRRRRRLLLIVRCALASITVIALASPALVERSAKQSVVFVLDHSLSLGDQGWKRVAEASRKIRANLGSSVSAGAVATGRESILLAAPTSGSDLKWNDRSRTPDPAGTNLARGIALASAVFPSGTSRHIVLISDGEETEGSLEQAAREAAVQGIRIHALPVAGELRSDVRITRLTPSQPAVSEGATLGLEAVVQASFNGKGILRLFENGVEVDRANLTVTAGELRTHRFQRSPEKRNIYHYRAMLEGFGAQDTLVENNEALTVVDVRGQPLLLYVEGESSEAHFLVDAMAKEGIRLDARTAAGIPSQALEIAGYDAIIFSGVPASEIGEARMTAIRDYVEKLGGGFLRPWGLPPDARGRNAPGQAAGPRSGRTPILGLGPRGGSVRIDGRREVGDHQIGGDRDCRVARRTGLHRTLRV
jgi:Ca-activated chloride channel homolog